LSPTDAGTHSEEGMAYKDLYEFLVAVSKHASLRATLKKGGAAADALMDEAGLSKDEKDLVRKGDKAAIKKYLGDKYSAASKVNIT